MKINFAGTPVEITEDSYNIAKHTDNDAVKVFLYLKDTYFHPQWNYENGVTFQYFLPKMKKGDS